MCVCVCACVRARAQMCVCWGGGERMWASSQVVASYLAAVKNLADEEEKKEKDRKKKDNNLGFLNYRQWNSDLHLLADRYTQKR